MFAPPLAQNAYNKFQEHEKYWQEEASIKLLAGAGGEEETGAIVADWRGGTAPLDSTQNPAIFVEKCPSFAVEGYNDCPAGSTPSL